MKPGILVAIVTMYAAGTKFLPPPISSWLLWAGYGAAWVAFEAIAEHWLARHRNRRKLADAGKPQPVPRMWPFVLLLAVLVPAMRALLLSDLPVAWRWAVLAGSLLVLFLAAKVVAALVRRRDEERRRREVADLAQRF